MLGSEPMVWHVVVEHSISKLQPKPAVLLILLFSIKIQKSARHCKDYQI